MGRCHCCDHDDCYEEGLLKEVKDLKEDCQAVSNAVHQGRYQDALAYLDQMMCPRWRSVGTCYQDYQIATAPPVRQGLWFYM